MKKERPDLCSGINQCHGWQHSHPCHWIPAISAGMTYPAFKIDAYKGFLLIKGSDPLTARPLNCYFNAKSITGAISVDTMVFS